MVSVLRTSRSLDESATCSVFGTGDGYGFEITHVRAPTKHIVCFSCQVGCPIGCTFCASGVRRSDRRFVRSLSTVEIVDAVNVVIRGIPTDEEQKPVLYSAMGEGEPLLAYDAVVPALLEFGRRPRARLALSTSGARVDRIRRLAAERWPVPLKLQLSIHSMFDEVRLRLMPGAGKLDQLIDAGNHYAAATGFPIELNYVLLDGINEGLDDAKALGELAARTGWVVKLNRFNRAEGVLHAPAGATASRRFVEQLRACGAVAEEYVTNGSDIGAACGQLSYMVWRDNQYGQRDRFVHATSLVDPASA